MRLIIAGKGMDVSNYLKDLVDQKSSKLSRYFKPETEVHVTLSIEKSRHIAEVTVPFDGVVLRAEESSGDMYSSIDASLKKLERMIRRHRTKLEKRLHDEAYLGEPIYGDYEEEQDYPKIVRKKQFPIKPMPIEEAELQMDMLGHSFFVFVNGDSGEVNVIYRRKDGNLGLIEPDYD